MTTSSGRQVGGIESYIQGIVPELRRAGHEVAFFYETGHPMDRNRILLPEGVPSWCTSEIGSELALRKMRQWQPALIYAQRFLESELQAETLQIAPAAFFAHDYNGACISGLKTFKNPAVNPCGRRFGGQCLLHYYPRRCGGQSPFTMIRDYRNQSRRLDVLGRFKAVVTGSAHMKSEYTKNGLRNVFHIPHFVPGRRGSENSTNRGRTKPDWRLLFLGRMDLLKGGRTFLDALTQVRRCLDRPLRVTFAGDGPDRAAWEQMAARLQVQDPGLSIEFTGWVSGPPLDSLWSDCDLLVVPSLWPEPFGLVGVEAGLHGVPAAAFAVGGIPEWLSDGINGHLAPGDPPTAAGLAAAISLCLRDEVWHARLRRGALNISERFTPEKHTGALLKVFDAVIEPA